MKQKKAVWNQLSDPASMDIEKSYDNKNGRIVKNHM